MWVREKKAYLPAILGGYQSAPSAPHTTKVRVRWLDSRRTVSDVNPTAIKSWEAGVQDGCAERPPKGASARRLFAEALKIIERIHDGEHTDEVLRITWEARLEQLQMGSVKLEPGASHGEGTDSPSDVRTLHPDAQHRPGE